MKLNTKLIALAAATAIGLSGHTMAAGTAAGLSVDNTVTLDYAVSGTQQASENATVSFLVDHKIDFSVDTVESPIIYSTGTLPGATVQYTFRVTNTGNGYVDFDLDLIDETLNTTLSSLTGTPNDDVTFEAISLFWDEDKDGTNNGNTENKTFIDALSFDDSGTDNIAHVIATVKLYELTPANAGFYNDGDISDGIHTVDGLIGGLRLTVRAAANELSNVPTATPSGDLGTIYTADDSGSADSSGVDLVFADAGNDNSEIFVGGVQISTSQLSVVKTVQVLNDPINNTTNPKAIPGAQVEYTITINNIGSSATAIDDSTGISYTITDNLESNAAIDKTQPIVITVDGGADTSTVDSNGDTTEGDIELTFNTPLAAGATNEIKFTAYIQ